MKHIVLLLFLLFSANAYALGTTSGGGNGTSSAAPASIDGTPIGATTSSTGKFTTLTANVLVSSGSAPTCGAGCASVTVGSTNTRGSMVSGSSVSAVTLNWNGTLGATPACTISDSNTTAVADISALSTSVITVSLASAVTSITIYWICLQ